MTEKDLSNKRGFMISPRGVLRVVIFPWLIWYLIGYFPREIRKSPTFRTFFWRSSLWGFQLFIYVLIGLPLTLFMLGEVIIFANEKMLGEQADYGLRSDFLVADGDSLTIPGGVAWSPEPPADKSDQDIYHRYLVELFSPVLVHKMAHRPEWDIPLDLKFDANDDPRDNVKVEPEYRPHTAVVYGELTAETEDSYYLTYSLYHAKDYDHPVRQMISDWTFHDNDNEGYHIRVDKASLQVVEAETWFHNRFLLFNHTNISKGTEPVHGKLHLENGTHPIIYGQSQGHGVRCMQTSDLPAIRKNTKIYRFRGDRPEVKVEADHSLQYDVTYELRSFDDWYARARGPFDETGMFDETIDIGVYPDGKPIQIGRYIAGYDYAKNGWSRPKPMWSWDDGWDQIPIFMWHFYPSHSFASHGGSGISHTYLYNRPCEKTFGMSAGALLELLTLKIQYRPGDKWAGLEERGGNLDRKYYWHAINIKLKAYVNYLFHALG